MDSGNLLKQAYDGLNNLTVYKNVRENKVVKSLCKLLQAKEKGAEISGGKRKAQNRFVRALVAEAEQKGLSGNIYTKCLLRVFMYDENKFNLSCEQGVEIKNKSLYRFARADLKTLLFLIRMPLTALVEDEETCEILNDYIPVAPAVNLFYDNLLAVDESMFMERLTAHLKKNGCGDLAEYGMFTYNSGLNALVGVANPDEISFDDIIGYEYQKNSLISNTKAFIQGYAANNVLLAGSRGTGKSSCVKACAKMFFSQGLRLIEITKEQILALPQILGLIGRRGMKFIIFVDDLSFEDFEIEYKHMKSLLEGSSGVRPENVLFYATSNRRHIISEKWSDRVSGSEDAEIHTNDMMNEKMSLSDRFGLTLTFSKPTPDEYLAIVWSMAQKEGINLDKNELNKKAMAWELNNKGISGRSARQFIDALKWELHQER